MTTLIDSGHVAMQLDRRSCLFLAAFNGSISSNRENSLNRMARRYGLWENLSSTLLWTDRSFDITGWKLCAWFCGQFQVLSFNGSCDRCQVSVLLESCTGGVLGFGLVIGQGKI